MITNYISKFVPNNSNRKKGKKQDKDEEHTKEEELLFLQQHDKNWQYCGWCKKKYLVAFNDCVHIKNSGVTQATTNTTTNKKLNKKVRPMQSNKLKNPRKEQTSSCKPFKRTMKLKKTITVSFAVHRTQSQWTTNVLATEQPISSSRIIK